MTRESVKEISSFEELLQAAGDENPSGLISFIEMFINDPSIFFDLSAEKRAKLESRMDKVLDTVKQ